MPDGQKEVRPYVTLRKSLKKRTARALNIPVHELAWSHGVLIRFTREYRDDPFFSGTEPIEGAPQVLKPLQTPPINVRSVTRR